MMKDTMRTIIENMEALSSDVLGEAKSEKEVMSPYLKKAIAALRELHLQADAGYGQGNAVYWVAQAVRRSMPKMSVVMFPQIWKSAVESVDSTDPDVMGDADELSEGYGLVAHAMIEKMVDMKVLREIRKKSDPETADMAQKVYLEMIERIDSVTGNGFQEAINRLNNAARMQDSSSIRNFVFKAANSLGMKLPHGMF